MEDANKLEVIRTWLGSGSINIFGRPFAGKDTHGRELVTLFNGVLLGGGDILRNSEVPAHVTEHIRAGRLAPTEDYVQIVLPYLSRDEFKGKPLILSSVGRWHGEEEGVLRATKAAGHETKAVIYLDIDDDAVRKRWSKEDHSANRGDRHDDTAEILEVRLKEYREKTLPVIDYYRDTGMLITIDSTASKQAVLDLLIQRLYEFATR